MKFTTSKKDIYEKLRHLTSIVPAQSSFSASNILIEADQETDIITIRATDMIDLTSIITFKAQVSKSGSVCIPAKNITDLIGLCGDSVINFCIEGNQLQITHENSIGHFPFIDSNMFPIHTVMENEQDFSINAKDLKKMIKKTIFCVSTEQHAYVMRGIYFRIENNLLIMAATDSKRVSEVRCTTDYNIESPYSVVLSSKSFSFIEKSIKDEEETINISFDNNKVAFKLNGIYIETNRLEGTFPNYLSAFKEQPKYTIMIDVAKLKEAVNVVSVVSKEDSDKLIKLSVSSSDVVLESVNSDAGSLKNTINGTKTDGENCFFGFNSLLFNSILNIIDSEHVLLKYITTEQPVWILNSEDYDNMKFSYIMMPMRVNVR
jgi:DNA polymerase-3 subunit beta